MSELEQLQKPHIHFKDKDKVERIISNLINGGKDRLQVIADFDRTLSRYQRDGVLLATTHNALDDSTVLPSFYREQAVELRDHYYQIEIDHTLTTEEKYPFMVEWWTKAHDLLSQCQLTRENVRNVVNDASIILREGCDWLFRELNDQQVPLLIFSAGIGDVIEEVIKQQCILYSNIKVVSNYMDFNDQDVMVGFRGDMIHIFNKNESAIHKSDYFEKIKHRHNVILMGDSMGDLKMAEGAVDIENILRIGFLNDKIEDRLSSYMDAYDIVLVSDETVDVVNSIIKTIV